MSTISSFKDTEKRNDIYRGKDCMKTFCEYLREHTVRTIDFFLKKAITNKETIEIICKCKNMVYL